MKINLVLFAEAKEIVGASQVEITLGEASTIADLREKLAQVHPQLEELMRRCIFSVDCRYASENDALHDGVEVGLIPPVSGG